MKNTINIHLRPLAMLAMLLAPLWVLALPLQGATGHPTVAAHHSASQPLPMHSSDGEVTAYDTIHLCDSEWYTLSYGWKDTTFNILGMIGSEFADHHIDIVHRVSGTPDTLFHLHMTYGAASAGVDSVTACDRYTWINGFMFSFSTNTPTHTLARSNRYGCDSTMTLNLTLHHSSSTTIDDSSCNAFVWNFTDKFGNNESRNYTHSGSYTGIMTNRQGCDSTVTLRLTLFSTTYGDTTVSACGSYTWPHTLLTYGPGLGQTDSHTLANSSIHGCDSIVTLHLNVFDSTGITIDTATCDFFRWAPELGGNNRIYAASLNDTTTQHIGGCDITNRLNLTIRNSYERTHDRLACEQLTWVDGNTYVRDTTVDLHLLTYQGCDSLLHLHLQIQHTRYGHLDTTVCDQLLWHDSLYTRSTSDAYWRDSLSAAQGCDTLTTLNLTIHYSDTGYTTVTSAQLICDNEGYLWNGRYYYATDTVTARNPGGRKTVEGCDSIDILQLTVLPAGRRFDTIRHCYTGLRTYTWHNIAYSHDFTDPHTAPEYNLTQNEPTAPLSVNGCDSLDVLILSFHRNKEHFEAPLEVCDTFHWYNGYNDSIYSRTNHNIEGHFLSNEGCDSLVHIDLTVNYSNTLNVTATACHSYRWNDTVYTTPGTYTQAFTNRHGCDSTRTLNLSLYAPAVRYDTLSVCNNYTWQRGDFTSLTLYNDTTLYYPLRYPEFRSAVTGCDTAQQLVLTIYHNSQSCDTVHSCENYWWNDSIFTTNSYHRIEGLTNQHGCDSTAHLYLYILQPQQGDTNVAACGSYLWKDNVIYLTDTVGPTYTMYNAAANGCDSVVTLHLRILPMQYNITADTTVCDEMVWAGTTYTRTGSYYKQFHPAEAQCCDSNVILHITVNHTNSATFSTTACESFTWQVADFDGTNTRTRETYLASNSNDTAHVLNRDGCDSLITLNLVLYSTTRTTLYDTACYAYSWRDKGTFSTNTLVCDTLSGANSHGCDSIETMAITILGTSYNTIDTTVCDRLAWIDGYTYTSDTSSLVTTLRGQSSHGCDSTITLNLSVHYSSSGNESRNACDSTFWLGQRYTVSGDYRNPTALTNAHGCDSTATLALTVRYTTYSVEEQTACDRYVWRDGNTYRTNTSSAQHRMAGANSRGCDSVITLHLTINNSYRGVADTQYVCDNFVWESVTYTTDQLISKYLQTVAGCDSLIQTQYVVNYSTQRGRPFTAEACERYAWYGQIYNQTGIYPHIDSIPNAAGCDSTIFLQLTIHHNSPTVEDTVYACDSLLWQGMTYTHSTSDYRMNLHTIHGCDSSAHLVLTVGHSSAGVDDITACDSLRWINNSLYTYNTNSPRYIIRSGNSQGCDSTVSLHLTIVPSPKKSYTRSACSSYAWHDSTYTTSGTYVHRKQNTTGCDSILTLNLAIFLPDTTVASVNPCDSYTFNGAIITADTTVTCLFSNQYSCDSTVVLSINIRHSSDGTETIDACDGYTWIDGRHYTADNSTATYTFPNSNSHGCDSTLHLNLAIHHSSSGEDIRSACDSLVWIDGHTYTTDIQNSAFVLPGMNQWGCDSVVTLTLTIRSSTSHDTMDWGYRSYTWNNGDRLTYTNDTTVSHTFVGANRWGCDSVETLHLVITPFPAPVIENIRDYMIIVDHYPFNNNEYITYNYYRWYCNNNLIAEGTEDYYSAGHALSGVYHVAVPADDDRILWIKSNEVRLNTSGISNIDEERAGLTIAPNPVVQSHVLNIAIDLPEEQLAGSTLALFDVQGRKITARQVESRSISLPANCPPGIYTILLTTADGRRIVGKVIVK